jgi:hypothetical protein
MLGSKGGLLDPQGALQLGVRRPSHLHPADEAELVQVAADPAVIGSKRGR